MTLAISATATAKVPLVGETSITMSAETRNDFTKTKAVTTTETIKFIRKYTVPPKSRLTATCTIKDARIKVPYEISFSSARFGVSPYKLRGVFHGANSFGFICHTKSRKI